MKFSSKFLFFFFLILIALHDTSFTILNATNTTYNIYSTNHNYICIVNNTYYTYKAKSTYNVHTNYRNNAMFSSELMQYNTYTTVQYGTYTIYKRIFVLLTVHF